MLLYAAVVVACLSGSPTCVTFEDKRPPTPPWKRATRAWMR